MNKVHYVRSAISSKLTDLSTVIGQYDVVLFWTDQFDSCNTHFNVINSKEMTIFGWFRLNILRYTNLLSYKYRLIPISSL